MKKIFVLLILSFVLISCNSNGVEENISDNKIEEVKKIEVVSSIIPLSSITKYIGGDYVDVKSLVPSGVSPHGFDLKPNQMVEINDSDLIVYLGLEHIDGFLDKAINDKNTLKVSTGIELIEGEEHHHEDEGEENHDEDEISEEGDVHEFDPHIWTSSTNGLLIAEKIQNKLIELQPENKEYFIDNFKLFKAELELVNSNFKNSIQNKNEKEFIVFHDAYNYLLNELGIKQENKLVFQKSVLSDPDSSEMKELIDEIKLHSVNIVYKEPQFSDSNLQKISNEYNLNVLILDPIGADDGKNGYIMNYKNNLENLAKIYE